MYLNDYEDISTIENIDELIGEFKERKIIGFLSLVSPEWQSPLGNKKLRRLKQYIIHRDDLFLCITNKVDVRASFVSMLGECDSTVSPEIGLDFIAYYHTDQVSISSIPINIKELSPELEPAISEISDALKTMSQQAFLIDIKSNVLKKGGGVIFDILRKLIGI